MGYPQVKVNPFLFWCIAQDKGAAALAESGFEPYFGNFITLENMPNVMKRFASYYYSWGNRGESDRLRRQVRAHRSCCAARAASFYVFVVCLSFGRLLLPTLTDGS